MGKHVRLRSAVEFREFDEYMRKARDRVKGRPFAAGGRITQRDGAGSPVTIKYSMLPLVTIHPDNTLEVLVTSRQLHKVEGNAVSFLRRELSMTITAHKVFRNYYNVVPCSGTDKAWWFKGLRLKLGSHEALNPRPAPKLIPVRAKGIEFGDTVRVGMAVLVAQMRTGAMDAALHRATGQPAWHRYVGPPEIQVDKLYTALVSASKGLPIDDGLAMLIVREIRSWYADPSLVDNQVRALKRMVKRNLTRLRVKAGALVWDTPYNPFDGD